MRLHALTPEEMTPEQRALYDAINGGPRGPVHVTADGSLEGPFNAFIHHPTVGAPLQRVGATLRYDGSLPPLARELSILTVAAAHRSEFEWYGHSGIASSVGATPEQIEAIRRGERPELEDEAAQAAVDVARRLLDRGDIGDEQYAEAVALLGEPGLVELTTLVGYYGILATQLNLFRVPLPDGVAPAFS
jgi:4-carboxymuconolactone decarboxylase